MFASTEELRYLIVAVLAGVGTVFMLISALGILRLPDVFTRMHAAGKAATLGVSCILLATGIYFYAQAQLPRMIALIALFFVTAPIATTTMARAAYRTGDLREFILRFNDLPAPEGRFTQVGKDPDGATLQS